MAPPCNRETSARACALLRPSNRRKDHSHQEASVKALSRKLLQKSRQNFIFAGRSISKMQGLVDELFTAHPKIQVKCLALDLLPFTNAPKAVETVGGYVSH